MLQEVSGAIDMFKLDHGRYPEKLEDLVRPPSYIDPSKWHNSYLKRMAVDGWGRDFIYHVCDSGTDYDLISLGADGKEGGEAFNEDLYNREHRK